MNSKTRERPGDRGRIMCSLAFPGILVLVLVCIAGCTGSSGPAQDHAGVPQTATATVAPGTQPEPVSTVISTVTTDCIERTGDSRSYPMNITDANKNPMTREQFLETNREYIAYLAKEVGEENATKMVTEEYRRSMGPMLLDPSSGNDTLISLAIDPVGDHVSGETFNITGTTNLPAGRELTLVIFRGNYDRAIPPCEDPWHDPVVRTAVARAGPSSGNTWSYRMDTTGLVPDDYLVYVRETQKDAFMTNTLFHLF